MEGSKNQRRLNGRESVTEFLRLLDSASVEAGEMFEQWARRRPHRLEPDEKLAEERYWEEVAFRKRAQYLRRKKLIRTKKTEKGLLLELTDQGREELLRRLVKERPGLPDGQVCLVCRGLYKKSASTETDFMLGKSLCLFEGLEIVGFSFAIPHLERT